jgi:hypothetical protein
MKSLNQRKTEKEIEKEEKERLIKETQREEGEEECCQCSFKEAWRSYKTCLEFTYITIRKFCIAVKNAIYNCTGACCFPIKERFCNCCDNIDRDLNPYKNPYYNPYDHL